MRIPTEDDFAVGVEILTARPDCEEVCNHLSNSAALMGRAQYVLDQLLGLVPNPTSNFALLCHHFAAALLIGYHAGVHAAQEEAKQCKPIVM